MPRTPDKEHTDMENLDHPLADLVRPTTNQLDAVLAKLRIRDRKDAERIARDRKAEHDAKFRFIWPAQYVRRTPESPGIPYFQRLNTEVARYASTGLGVHKIAEVVGVSHRTVRRILRPGRDLVTIRYSKVA